jgi:P27 family predicted phage terminase small subunit
MKGRKPKPTHIKIVTGNPGRRPLNTSEPTPLQAIPDCPEHITGLAREEWERMAEDLFECGLLTVIDRVALEGYCVAYARWVDAEEAIKKHGVLVKSPNGFPMQSPLLAIANKAMAQLRGYLAEFGMTPSSRSRITATPPNTGVHDPLAEFTRKNA